ncbi:enoyl-CoA hydratase/isomerase family protein [Hyphomonas sp.]|uniref:enoyl-CoA hydratase/isomerase family protein n=1 Tax=Hyphomonas sp. TaxID=87 RepID=UPI0030FA10C1
MMPEHAEIVVTYEADLVRLKLNRPKQLNALNENIRTTIASVLNDLIERPDIRLLVISGEGKSFCSGADLKTTSYPKVEGSWSTRRNRTSTWQRVLEQLDRIPQVTIASMQGHVVGGGALLATACDFRVISQDVVLRIPELALGIPNVWNGTPLLAREVGLPRARDWVMTTRKVFADELMQSGWAQRLAAPNALTDITTELIDELLAVPPAALAMTRSMTSALGRANSGMQLGWADADLQQWALTEEEYKETVDRYIKTLRP